MNNVPSTFRLTSHSFSIRASTGLMKTRCDNQDAPLHEITIPLVHTSRHWDLRVRC